MRVRRIVRLVVFLVSGALAGCQIDNRTLKTSPSGSGGTGAAGHGGASVVSTGLGGFRGTGGSGGSGAGSGGSTLPTILLGNFESGTALPQDPRFATYQSYAYNPGTPSLPSGNFVNSPLVSPGYNSNYALGLNWKVIDPVDGTPNYPGVGLRTIVGTGFVDLSGYDRIVFAQQYQHADSCKPLQSLTVFISCDELNTSYQGTIPVSPIWTNSSLPFSTFVEPSYLPPSGHSLAQCLAVANGVVFQAQVDLADGECASGSLTLDNIEIRAGGSPPGPDGGAGGSSSGITLIPGANGTFDGSNAAGVLGAWGAAGDYYDSNATAGAGSCPQDGFSPAQCSSIHSPKPGSPFVPDPSGRMCTNGTAAQVIPDGSGQPAYSYIWGDFIFFDLNQPPASVSDGGLDASTRDAGADAGTGPGIYDAIAHGITGLAFDVDGTVSRMRVEFATSDTWLNAAYWDGASQDVSPVNGPGHYEIRWTEVGGPSYLASPPPFDPSKLEEIRFHVTSETAAPIPYDYCIKNIVMLTGP